MDDLYDATALLQGTFSAAKSAGIPSWVWERFRSDPGFRERTRRFWESGGYSDPRLEGSPSALYGPMTAVFGPDEWEAFFKVRLTHEQERAAEDFPWENVADRNFGGSHFFFLGLGTVTVRYSDSETAREIPLNTKGLMELTEKCAHWQNRPRLGQRKTRWMTGPEMPRRTPQTRWYCIPLAPRRVDVSLYEVPYVAELLLANILYYQKYGRLLMAEGLAICSDIPAHSETNRLALEVERATKRLFVVSAQRPYVGTDGAAFMRRLPS